MKCLARCLQRLYCALSLRETGEGEGEAGLHVP